MLAVITGASAGIGATFARHLAKRGHSLLLVARRLDRMEALARDLRSQFGVPVEVHAADLTDPDALEAVARRIADAADLGVLINNAGFGTSGYFWETDPASQDQMHRLHVVATTRLTHAALSNLVPRGKEGTGVINVSSVAAFTGAPQNVSYCATKAWMNTFTSTLAVELGGRGSPVRVQALCPGYTLSEFHDVMGSDRSGIPGSLWMTADFVVGESLQAFDRGQLIVVPGWKYKAAVGVLRMLPQSLVGKLSTAAVRRYRKNKHGDVK